MPAPSDNLDVIHLANEDRFELLYRGVTIGRMLAKPLDGKMAIPSLDVDPEHRGQGWATWFASEALIRVRELGFEPAPTCPFVQWVMRQEK